jgi:hypothetical protein
MRRGSKYNPYECPECGYKTSRKWNIKLHLERAHGLVPFLPEQSKEAWVWAQLRTLARQYAEAELADDKDKRERCWRSLISLYTYHRGLFHVTRIVDVIGEERQELQKRIRREKGT